jgi:hypothetical protein
MHVPEQRGGEASQTMVRKGGGGVVSQKKGDREATQAREHDLESFVASVTRHKVNRGNFPQKCHVTCDSYS